MKCVVKTVLALCAVCVLAGCASNKSSDSVMIETSDSYDSETSKVGEPINADKDEKPAKKSSGFSFDKIFTSRYVEYEKGSVFTPKTFGGRKQETVDFVIYPKTDSAGFCSSYMSAYYYLTFNNLSRKDLIAAMNKYLKDFDEKKLDRNDKKSFKAYGKTKAFVRWGTLKANNPYSADGVSISLGYRFEDKSPYFTIQMETVNDENTAATAKKASDVVTSMRLVYYLTKNQCRGFIENLSDQKVNDVMYSFIENSREVPEEEDSYYDDANSDEVKDVE